MPGNTSTIGARVPYSLKQRLANVCDEANKNLSDGLIEAIEHYVERQEYRHELRREAKAAHDHYVLTGLSYSHSDVGEWLETLKNGNRELPKWRTSK